MVDGKKAEWAEWWERKLPYENKRDFLLKKGLPEEEADTYAEMSWGRLPKKVKDDVIKHALRERPEPRREYVFDVSIWDKVKSNIFTSWRGEPSATIYLRFDRDLTEDYLREIVLVIEGWYSDSEARLWKRAFQWMGNISQISPNVVEFGVDLGGSNCEEAITALAKRLYGYGLKELRLGD